MLSILRNQTHRQTTTGAGRASLCEMTQAALLRHEKSGSHRFGAPEIRARDLQAPLPANHRLHRKWSADQAYGIASDVRQLFGLDSLFFFLPHLYFSLFFGLFLG